MRQLNVKKIVKCGLAGLAVLIVVYPILWMIVGSLAPSLAYRNQTLFSPAKLTFSGYRIALSDQLFFACYKNSVIVAVLTTGGTLVLALMAGYSLSRFHYRFSSWVQMFFLSARIFPTLVLLSGFFIAYGRWRHFNTYMLQVMMCTTLALPLAILVFRGFFEAVGVNVEEAAAIDGANHFRILFSIAIPLIKPGIVAVGVYSFLVCWDDLLCNMVLAGSNGPNLSVGFLIINGPGMSLSGAMLAFLPILIIFIFAQKYLIEGLPMGVVKR